MLGTKIRDATYNIIRGRFPDSMCLLEIAKQAAWMGSDLGNVHAWLKDDGDYIQMLYLMDMREASDPLFLANFKQYRDEGNPINHADISEQVQQGSLGKTPDLTAFEFRRPKAEMPYLKRSQD